MCSEHVILMVPRRCGTNVLGLWDYGGALLRSVEEHWLLHFQPTVRRAAPCTTSCCPQLRAPSPCSSTHPGTPARTLWLCGGTLKEHTALSLKLLLVLRVQVRSEAKAPILGGDNASSMLHLRPGAACFAAPEVLTVLRPTRACVVWGCYRCFMRVCAPPNGCIPHSTSWTGHVHTDIVYICIFSESSLENRANVGP